MSIRASVSLLQKYFMLEQIRALVLKEVFILLKIIS